MKKLSKLLVLLLSLVMIVSLFAGCKPADTDPSDDDGSNPSQNAPSVVFPLEQPVTFKMGVRGEKDYQELMEKCEWYKYLCEKTNVFIECVVLGSDAVGKLNTLITNGTPPDVVLGPITLSSSDVVDLGSQGRLLSLNKYLEDKTLMPNYQRLLEAVPEALKKMTAPDGNIWSLASINNSPGTAWESALTVNIEWLKQVPGYEDGKTFPKNPEEFTEVLRYFKAHDMNGNGDATDEIPFLMVSSSRSPADAQANLQGLMQLWGIGTKDGDNDYYVHIDDNDVVTIAPTTENYRDCLRWVQKWYDEGLLWENFFASVKNAEFSGIHGNEVAKWGFYNGSGWHYNGDLPNRNQPWRDAQTIVEPFDTGYEPHLFINPAVTGNLNAFTVFSTCKNPEILLAWYDQFLSVEGTLAVTYGMSNEWERYEDAEDYRAYYEQYPTWYKDENGKYTFPQLELDYKDLKEFNADLNDKKLADHTVWGTVFNLNAVCKGVTPEEYLDGSWPAAESSSIRFKGQWIEDHPEYFDYNVWPRPYSTAEEAEELVTLWPSVKRVIGDWEVQFIKGEKSLDADWEEYQQDLKDAGSEQMIEILQAMWDRVK
ncbi:MAG: hypothetical protein IJA45_03940 [Oscillospiraceae bacterium]|nr:hypothetical protein [Oscillospiraceae bacterium]